MSGVLVLVALVSTNIGADSWQLRQVTTDAQSQHSLPATAKAFSPDGNWVCYDRNVGAIRDSSVVAKAHVVTGEEVVLYDAGSIQGLGPGIAAVSFFPGENRVIFIHGPAKHTGLQYERFRRFGAMVSGDGGTTAVIHADARDTTPPYTPGALRGGTHVHDPGGPGNRWIGFTYNDMIMRNRGEALEQPLNLRTIGVTMLGNPVAVDEDIENWNGEGYTVLLVPVVPKPQPGTDAICRAAGDGWVGREGYRKDGKRQYARAFVGTLADDQCDVFIVDIPSNITVPAPGGPLEGTDEAFPAPPEGTQVRRLTQLGTVSGYIRSNADGTLLAFQAEDGGGKRQIFLVPATGGTPHAVTAFEEGVCGNPCWHPSGHWLAVPSERHIYRVSITSGRAAGEPLSLTRKPFSASASNTAFSPDGARIAFNMTLDGVKQIFVLDSGK